MILETLRQQRIDYGFSQSELAQHAGITREYLNKIENGKLMPAEDLKEKLLETLIYLNPKEPLEMLFDYVRVRFPTKDIAHIVEEVLQIRMKYMGHEDYGFYSYEEHYYWGDIVVMCSQDEKKGVLLELKGKGCRQFESMLKAQKRTWFDFFQLVSLEQGVFKRIDLAINDKTGILDIPALAKKCEDGACISVFRSFKNYRSGDMGSIREKENIGMGNTLYIGSLKSEVYFCVYEKDYEQHVKHGTPLEETEVKNRFEIRLKNERAYHAIMDLLEHRSAEKTAFSIINRYVTFLDKEEGIPQEKWEINRRWAWFIGGNREELKLTTRPEPYTLEKTIHWIQRQVAPSLKTLLTLDANNNTNVVNEILENAALSERHVKLIMQQLQSGQVE